MGRSRSIAVPDEHVPRLLHPGEFPGRGHGRECILLLRAPGHHAHALNWHNNVDTEVVSKRPGAFTPGLVLRLANFMESGEMGELLFEPAEHQASVLTAEAEGIGQDNFDIQ